MQTKVGDTEPNAPAPALEANSPPEAPRQLAHGTRNDIVRITPPGGVPTDSPVVSDAYVAAIARDLKRWILAIAVDAQRSAAVPALPDAARRMIEQIADRARHVDRELQGLIDAALLGAGNLDLQRAPTNLGKLVEDVVENTVLPSQRSRLQVELAHKATANVDPARIGHALGSLVRATLDHAKADTPIVVRLDGAGHRARISVLGIGLGVLESEAQRLFTPGGGDPRYGIGVALRMIQRVIEANDGHVFVELGPGGAAKLGFELAATPQRGMLARRQ